MKRAFITIRATGERIYLDDRDPPRDGPEPAYRKPPPMIIVECEVCGHGWPQWDGVEFGPADSPFVCAACQKGPMSGPFFEIGHRDREAIGMLGGVLQALRKEIGHVRRAAR